MQKKASKILGCLIFIVIVAFIAIYQGVIPVTATNRPENAYHETIPMVISQNDTDNDGFDDQTDILNAALSYVQTRPKYKSRYYNSGYPDDGYGVCTDVVAFAFREAGFDLMERVQRDIAQNPNSYDIAEPDRNIDFRRVRNLNVFFQNNAQSLSLDVTQVDTWQGGDIVVFANHIGVLSDRRNKDGVPYVIHHNSPFQRNYEEDILAKRRDIVGHYRLP